MKYLLLFLLTSCMTVSKITYTTTIPNGDIHTTKGILVGDYIEVYLDNYIPKYQASPAEIDAGFGECYILDSLGRTVLFISPVDLINFFEDRGYYYEGTGEYIVNSKIFSSWNFRKND